MGFDKKWILNTILTIAATLCFFALLESAAHMGKHLERYWWFLAGIGIYALTARFVAIWRSGWMLEMLRQSVRFIVALFLGRRVSEFVVADDESGHVNYTGKNNILILLAPYCLLVLPLVLLAVKMLFPYSAQWFTALIGFSVAYHCHAVFVHLNLNGDDILMVGRYRALCFIFMVLSLCLGVVLYGVDTGLSAAFSEYFSSVWHRIHVLVVG